MRSKRDRILAAAAVLAVIATAPVFASAAQEQAQQPVTLRLMSFSGGNADAFQAMADMFKEVNPNVEIVVEPVADADEYQRNAFLIYASDDAPDIARFNATVGSRFVTMAQQGILRPMDDLYEKHGWYDVFPQGTIDYLSHDGHVYAVNVDVVWIPFVYYNKDIFSELGLSPPETWDEFYHVVDTVRDAGLQAVSTVYEMGVQSFMFEAMFLRAVTEEGYRALGSNWRHDSSPAARQYKWTNPDAVQIWEYIKEFADRGSLIDGYAGMTDYNLAKAMFTRGDAAMYVDGSWAAGAEALYKEADFEWDYFYFPAVRDDIEFPSPLGGFIADALVLPAAPSTPEKEAAIDEFLGFMLAKERMIEFSRIVGSPQGRLDFGPEDLAETLTPMQQKMMSELPTRGQLPTIASGIPREIYEVQIDSVDQLLTGGKSPLEVAQMMQDVYEKWQQKEAE